MCIGLYWQTENMPVEMRALLYGARKINSDIECRLGNIEPGEYVPTVANCLNMRAHGFFMRWGYPENDKLIPSVKAETVQKKLEFVGSYENYRCVIPVNYYYAWTKLNGRKVKYRVYSQDSDYMFLAGIYMKRDNDVYFVLLTQPAGKDLAGIDSRMPVVVPREYCLKWIDIHKRPKNILDYFSTRVRYEIVDDGDQ